MEAESYYGLGITFIAFVSGGNNIFRGLIIGFYGLMLATVGTDPRPTSAHAPIERLSRTRAPEPMYAPSPTVTRPARRAPLPNVA